MKIRSSRTSGLIAIVALAVMSVASGCHSSGYAERFGLGSMDKQKAKAADFDPFPLNDIGPPVVGARPHGFFNPLPEPRRNENTARQSSPYAGYNR